MLTWQGLALRSNSACTHTLLSHHHGRQPGLPSRTPSERPGKRFQQVTQGAPTPRCASTCSPCTGRPGTRLAKAPLPGRTTAWTHSSIKRQVSHRKCKLQPCSVSTMLAVDQLPQRHPVLRPACRTGAPQRACLLLLLQTAHLSVAGALTLTLV